MKITTMGTASRPLPVAVAIALAELTANPKLFRASSDQGLNAEINGHLAALDLIERMWSVPLAEREGAVLDAVLTAAGSVRGAAAFAALLAPLVGRGLGLED